MLGAFSGVTLLGAFSRGVHEGGAWSHRGTAGRQMVQDWMQWTGFVLSVIAFGLALPTAFQMWWGKPSLEIKLVRDRLNAGVGLTCEIRNKPIERQFLRWLGVCRKAAHGMRATATVSKAGSGELVGRLLLEIDVGGNAAVPRVDLHPAVPSFARVMVQGSGETSAMFGKRKILPGEYSCKIEVAWGHDTRRGRKSFSVTDDANSTLWTRCD